MPIQYRLCKGSIRSGNEKEEYFLEVTGFDGETSFFSVPDHAPLQGEIPGKMPDEMLPVRSIGPHAMERRSELREVVIPDTVTSLRAFSFHNCKNLRRISMTDSVIDVYDGVIRHCDSLREIEIRMLRGQYAGLKALLADFEYSLRIILRVPQDEARVMLTFPAYNHFYDEDTMARAIHAHIDGSGMAFRECVMRSGVDYAAYDSAFSRVCTDNPAAAGDVAMDRLMTPYQLGAAARSAYERFLREHAENVLRSLLLSRQPDALERIRFLSEYHLTDGNPLLIADAARAVLPTASQSGQSEAAAILMEAIGRIMNKDTAGRGSYRQQFSLDEL